jgi:hypothetical protein
MATSSNTSSSQSARLFSLARIGGVATRLVKPLLLVGAAVSLSSCLGGGSSAVSNVRMINLVTDSPDLELTIDQVDVSDAEYGDMTVLTAAHLGNHSLQVAAVTPSDLVTLPMQTYTGYGTPQPTTFENGFDYTLIAYGTVAVPKFLVVPETHLGDTPPQPTFVYQVIDAAEKGPPVDVYITVPDAGIPNATKIGTLSFGETTAVAEPTIVMPEGLINTSAILSANVTIELRDPTTGAVVIPPSTVTLNEQQRLLYVIADNLAVADGSIPNATPIVIDAFVTDTGAAGTGNEFSNTDDPAELSFVNVTDTAPAYDVVGGLDLTSPLATNIAFGEQSPYAAVNSGTAGAIASLASDPSDLQFLVSFTSVADQSYVEYAVGPIQLEAGVVLATDRRFSPAQAELRFLNAIWTLEYGPGIDIYVTPYGQGLDILATNTARPPPTSSDIEYKTATTYTQLVPGRYQVYFTYTGTSNVFLGPEDLQLAPGSITTFVVTNRSNGVMMLPFNDAAGGTTQ